MLLFALAAALALAHAQDAEMDVALTGADLAAFLHFPTQVKDGTPNQILTEWVKEVCAVRCALVRICVLPARFLS